MMCPSHPDTNDCCHDYSEVGCVAVTPERMSSLCQSQLYNKKCSLTESRDYSLKKMPGLTACETTGYATQVDLHTSLAGKLGTKLLKWW